MPAVSSDQLRAFAALLAVPVAVACRPLLCSSVNAAVVVANGSPVQGLSVIFMALLGLAVTMAVQAVGTLLLFALLIACRRQPSCSHGDLLERWPPPPLSASATERQTLLRKCFEATDESGNVTMPGPSVVHRAIARMTQCGTIRVVLTMNFDRLFEQALREVGIEPVIVATEADARGLPPLHTLEHCVIHLHGDYLNAASMRNTAAELSGYGAAAP